jgi:bla regulator protein blaR1
MDLFNDWISENLLKALGWTLVHSFWQLIIIAGLLWIVLKIARPSKPALTYAMTIVALLLSFGISLSTFLYEFDSDKVAPQTAVAGDFEVFFSHASVQNSTVQASSFVQEATLWIDQNVTFLVNFWFLGVILFLFRLVNGLSEIRNLRKSSTMVTDFQLQKIVFKMAGKMGIKPTVQLRTTHAGISPLTFGAFKPIILLPAGLLFQLSPIQLEAIISHELAHVKRNDFLVNLLLSGLEVIFFYHPCYWWMNNTLKELRENAADDLVIKAGIEPENLATSLAEVLNFAKQNPPELALAACKKRNPTLQRIKRMLGYPAQNYPQNPIISIPMLFTLLLSAGLIASAQQDTAHPTEPVAPISIDTPADLLEAIEPIDPDTTGIKKSEAPDSPKSDHFGKNVMVFSDGGYSYRISGDTLISDKDTIIISGKTKVAFEKLREFNGASMPKFNMPNAPVFPMEFDMAPLPDFNMQIPFDMEVFAMAPMIPMEPFDLAMAPPMPVMLFPSDTTKMTKEEQIKWSKEMADRSKEWAKLAEVKAEEWAKRSEEWAAKWKEGEAERNEKIEAWKKEFEPKMKEFEQKMKEWQTAQEPKMKEFEQRMKEWEATQKPKMEEFQKRMEVWQKEHEAKLQEFQKLIQSELNKDDKKQ